MRQLQWWMHSVGIFYVLLAIFNTPLIIRERLLTQYPNLGVAVDSVAAQALIDTWFMFGLEVAVIGTALIYFFSRESVRHTALCWTVIGLELIRGIVDDVYLLASGVESPGFYVGWIVMHTVIIATGVAAIRAAKRDASSTIGGFQPADARLA